MVSDLPMPRRTGASNARPVRNAGFTLLEVLVTLVVFGILVATLAQGLQVGLRGWTASQGIGAGTATLEAVDLALRELLGRASPADPLTYDRAFTGTPTAMAFTTTMPERFGASLPLEGDVSLLVSNRHRLVLRWRPHHARWIATSPPPATEMLVDGVVGVRLAFYQPVRDGHGGRWLTSWSSPDLPRLVRIHFEFAPDDRRHWPDIVAATLRERAPP
jgi:general secretion pathway protein J